MKNTIMSTPENFKNQWYDSENFGPVLASRVISSFTRMAWKRTKMPFGSYPMNKIFLDWMIKEVGLSEDDAWEIFTLASNGKLELEKSAKEWLDREYGDSESRKKYLPKYQKYLEEDDSNEEE